MVSKTVSIGEIGNVNATVLDVDKAAKFYTSAFGMRLLYSDEKCALCECNGARILLSREDASGKRKRSVIYFKVDDIRSAFYALIDKGVEIVIMPRRVIELPDYAVWIAFFRDLDGNLLVLISENELA